MMAMLVLNTAILVKFARKHRDAALPLERWLTLARAADWGSIVDVRKLFPSADGIAVRNKGRPVVIATVFNIKGNEYRLITVFDFVGGIIIIRDLLTHAQYSRNAWKDRI